MNGPELLEPGVAFWHELTAWLPEPLARQQLHLSLHPSTEGLGFQRRRLLKIRDLG